MGRLTETETPYNPTEIIPINQPPIQCLHPLAEAFVRAEAAGAGAAGSSRSSSEELPDEVRDAVAQRGPVGL